MPSVLNVVITDAGIAEVVNAQHTGTAPVVLAQVGFGRGIYTPTADQTALHDEIKRVSTIAGGVAGSNIMHIQALDSGESAYAVYEVGVYTASGTLFAVYSQPIPILHKVANSSIMCVIDFVLSGVEPTAVTVGDTDYTLAPATTTNQGVVELATDAEVIAGTDTERAVTPAGGAAAYVALSGNQTITGRKTFNDGITGDLTGSIPIPAAEINRGCIILARVRTPENSPLTIRLGSTVTGGETSSDTILHVAAYDSNGWTGGARHLLGQFFALSEVVLQANEEGIILLIKR